MNHYSHFTLKERELLKHYMDIDLSQSEIAIKLGRNKSSISRGLVSPFKALLPIEGKSFQNILKSHSNSLLLNSISLCPTTYGKEDQRKYKWSIKRKLSKNERY